MPKPRRARSLPPTPTNRDGTQPDEPKLAHRSSGADEVEVDPVALYPHEPRYLVEGTRCLRGHDPGSEMVEPRLGKVPGQRITRIGVGLIVWALLGLAFLTNLLYISLALIGAVLWQSISALVQRRAGHRGHCWRTRSWRYAWGGIVPTPRDRSLDVR